MKKKYYVGKCDYDRSGRKNCKAFITWQLENGRFSMQAEIWNPRETDIYVGGQCIGTVAAMFPDNAIAQQMLDIWEHWHLNDMQAGSPRQMEFLGKNQEKIDKNDYYQSALQMLKDANLSPDMEYLHNGKPYEYGTAWLTVELPESVIAMINSWPGEDE